MSSFTDPLTLEIVTDSSGHSIWATERALVYELGGLGSNIKIVVPSNFQTDLATIPRIFWSLFLPFAPKYAAAAVLHDFLCEKDGFSRFMADCIFLEAMKIFSVGRLRRWCMFGAVRFYAIITGKK